jgi:2-methylcitrate dehydratase PrpD
MRQARTSFSGGAKADASLAAYVDAAGVIMIESDAETRLAEAGLQPACYVPEEVVIRSRELFGDFLAVTLAGSVFESSRCVISFIRAMETGGACTIFGTPFTGSPQLGALANGTSAHATELDDVEAASSLHPGVAVMPSAFAAAEFIGASLNDFLIAAIMGYEVTLRVGRALNPAGAYRRGFHPTGVAGAFGASMAVGRLIGLTVEQQRHAFGIAATLASGSMEYLSDGSWTKRLNAGWAAQSGLVAAFLARSGFSGPRSALTGRFGALHSYTDEPSPDHLTAELGRSFAIMRVAVKPYACCRYNHPLIDAALALRRDPGFSVDAVRSVELGVLKAGAPLVADPIDRKRAPQSIVDAQFSAPFAVAVALHHGRAGLDEYSLANLQDQTIRALMSVTSCHTDPELDRAYPERWPGMVQVVMTDGRKIVRYVDFPLGEPENPVSRAERKDKFSQLAGLALEDDAVCRLWDLIESADVSTLRKPVKAVAILLATAKDG